MVGVISCATGNRPEITATGAGTATLSTALQNIGQLVIVSAPLHTTVTDTQGTTDTVNLIRGRKITINDTINTDDSIVITGQRWSNQQKNSSTWTNQQKS
jgi:hypothetical protein